MPFPFQRFFNRKSSSANLKFLIFMLMLLPLTACGRYKARRALEKTQYFAEILRREGLREIGQDGFFRDNLKGNRDPEVRLWCAVALGRIADPRTLPLLYGALRGEDAGLRAASAFAIGEIQDRDSSEENCSVRDPRAVLELFGLLDDSSVSVRMRAVEALGKIGARADAADVVRRVENFSGSRSASGKAYLGAAATALARLGDPAAIPFLDRLSAGSDPDLRQHASEARKLIQSQALQRADVSQSRDARPEVPCDASTRGGRHPGPGITRATSYALAAYRKNSTIAQIETTRGTIEIELFREDAPLTVDRFVSMAKRMVYDDTELSKAAGLIEGGDPKKWPGLNRAVQSEINMRPLVRGRVAMPLSGRDSDAGRFFITTAPQPFLDGVNTCFGHVISGMQIADRIGPGDRIRRILIKEEIHFHDYQRY